MKNKTILSLAVTAAFVVGTITTGTFAYAQQSGGGIPQALEELELQFAGIQDFLMGLEDRVTQNESDIANLTMITADHENRLESVEEDTSVYEVRNTDVIQFEFVNQHMKRAACNPGDHIISGGFNFDDTTHSTQPITVIDSLPVIRDGLEQWQVRAEVFDPNDPSKFEVIAWCETTIP